MELDRTPEPMALLSTHLESSEGSSTLKMYIYITIYIYL